MDTGVSQRPDGGEGGQKLKPSALSLTAMKRVQVTGFLLVTLQADRANYNPSGLTIFGDNGALGTGTETE